LVEIGELIMRTLILTIAIVATAHAYEVETHSEITRGAFRNSILGSSAAGQVDLYFRLGFDRTDLANPFRQLSAPSCTSTSSDPAADAYVDAQPQWLSAGNPDAPNRRFRCIQSYEQLSFFPTYRGLAEDTTLGPTPVLRLEAWLMRGSIREDDLKASSYASNQRPDPDPCGEQDRPVNHFYVAPANEEGTPFGFGERALDWAMGEVAPLTTNGVPDPSRGNHFSYMDARRNFYLALTYKNAAASSSAIREQDALVRQNLWASTMLSLGHVVHLLQDQASPQHARAEAHNYLCRGFLSLFNAPISTRTYENFINFRLIRVFFANAADSYTTTNRCEEKKWRSLFAAAAQDPPSPAQGWFRPGNTYPTPQFAVQRKFFTTRVGTTATVGNTDLATLNGRNGLGDYSNRSFYTERKMQGSVIGSFAFISPPRDTDDLTFSDGTLASFFVPGKGNVKVKALYWKPTDNIAPNYPDPNQINGKVPIVSYGQWGFLGGVGIKRRILTLDNYNQMADMLIPRAVAYTEGFLNFFFRGKLVVEAPLDGLFGAIDHGIAHTVDADGYPRCSTTVSFGPDTWCVPGRIYGFTKLRLKVRNDTATITESGGGDTVPQTMVATVANPTTGTNAGLYAIARYHRNLCYRPDLSSERRVLADGTVLPEPSNCSSRTTYQEISISKPKVATAAELNGATTTAMTFDFSSDPIPINATDLIIQVLYRGQLGQETDGIAVGSFDVKEPSYVTVWNNSDWGACNGAWVQNFGMGCTPSGGTSRVITESNICIGSQVLLVQLTATHGNVPIGRFLRVAVLIDSRNLTTRARVILGSGGFTAFSKVIRGQVRQGEKEIITVSAPYAPEPMFFKRGRIGSFRPIPANLISGTDAQPSNDAGPLDVGNLLPAFAVADLPNLADFQFPDTAVSVAACPTPSP
jgi:hypothetical protein